jgi:tetratricopeptide (TPR) repeat protein
MNDRDPQDIDSEFSDWEGGLTTAQTALQQDLSCLVDGELDEAAAARVMVQLEDSTECREYFDDIQRFARLHRDLAEPDRILVRIAMLTGADLTAEAESADLVHRLATIFYQLGKAYALTAIEPEAFAERVFETAVPVEATKTRGRGFVDGVLLRDDEEDESSSRVASVDWQGARHMLNGRLERIEDPLEKGQRLLDQALAVDPSHEEAKIYLAFLHNHKGKTLKAAELYKEVFHTAVKEENRGHAAVQLGRLYKHNDEPRRALAYWRWVTMSGLADADDRFWFVRWNIGSLYTTLRNQERALYYFRKLLDVHPQHATDLAYQFASFPETRDEIAAQAGFSEALIATCPEIFEDGTLLEGAAG